MLSAIIEVSGCHVIMDLSKGNKKYILTPIFIGNRVECELAAYTWDALQRQMSQAEEDFKKQETRTRKQVDIFRASWAMSAAVKAYNLFGPRAKSQMTKKYCEKYQDLSKTKPMDAPNLDTNLDMAIQHHGFQEGSKAVLNQAAGHDKKVQITHKI